MSPANLQGLLGVFLFFVLLVVATIVSTDSLATLRLLKPSGDAVTEVPLRNIALEHSNRLLRVNTEADIQEKALAIDSEERTGVFRTLWKKLMMNLKIKCWLRRGKSPEKVKKKLNLKSTSDKKYYYKYFVGYHVKYPAMQSPDLPEKIAKDIMNARLKRYLKRNFSPAQVLREYGVTYKYYVQYCKMWGALQAKLSKKG